MDFEVEDKPYEETSISEKLKIAKKICIDSILSNIAAIESPLKAAISIYFIGLWNETVLLSSVGFSMMWVNMLAMIPCLTMIIGYTTIAAQAYGAKNFPRLVLVTQQIFTICGIYLVCLSLLVIFFMDSLLKLFITDEELINLTHQTTIAYLPSSLGWTAFQIGRSYLNALNIFELPAYSIIISILFQFPCAYYFSYKLGLKHYGVGIATSITDISLALILFLYIKYKDPCPLAIFKWTKRCFHKLGRFIKETAAQGLPYTIQWSFYELSTFLIALLHDKIILNGQVIFLNLITIVILSVDGLGITSAVYAGNYAGEGYANKAKKVAKISVYIAFIYSLVVVTIVAVLRYELLGLYSKEEAVVDVAVDILNIFMIGIVGEYLQTSMMSSLKSLNQEKYFTKCLIVCDYGIGLGTQIVLGFVLNWSYKGIWIGFVVSILSNLSCTFYKWFTIDWEDSVRIVNQAMKKRLSNMAGDDIALYLDSEEWHALNKEEAQE